MKKLLLFLLLLNFNLSFSKYLDQINLKLLKKNLLMHDFNYNEESNNFISFNQKQGKYKQFIYVQLNKGNITSLGFDSAHFNINPDKKFINNNLEIIFKIISNSINDKKLVAKIDEIFKNYKN